MVVEVALAVFVSFFVSFLAGLLAGAFGVLLDLLFICSFNNDLLLFFFTIII